jgi:hypothetical protein
MAMRAAVAEADGIIFAAPSARDCSAPAYMTSTGPNEVTLLRRPADAIDEWTRERTMLDHTENSQRR